MDWSKISDAVWEWLVFAVMICFVVVVAVGFIVLVLSCFGIRYSGPLN